MSSNIAFEKGVRNLKRSSVPNLQIQKDAVDLLTFIFSDLNSKLVGRTKEEFKNSRRKPPEGLNQQHAQNAVRKIVGPKLKDFASAEGQKNVLKFENKMLRYDERPVIESYKFDVSRAAAVKALKPKPLGYEFFRGLSVLTSRIHPDRRLNTDAKEFIANLLHNLMKIFAHNTAMAARGKKLIDESEVQKTVASLLTPELASHAHVEGVKSVMLYSEGTLYIPDLPDHHHHHHHRHYHHHLVHLIELKKLEEEKKKIERMRAAFSSGVRQLAMEVRNGCKLESKAFHHINNQLELLVKRFAVATCGVATSENSTEVTTYEIETAVQEMIPQGMASYAVSEGRRAVTLFSTGALEIPKERKKKDESAAKPAKRARKSRKKLEEQNMSNLRKRSRKKPTELDFTVSELALLKEMDCSVSMDRAGGDLLNKILLDVFRKVVSACKEKRNSRSGLTAAVVQKAVTSFFPRQMKDHAIAAGDKAVAVDAPTETDRESPSDVEMGRTDESERENKVFDRDAGTPNESAPESSEVDSEVDTKKKWFKRFSRSSKQ